MTHIGYNNCQNYKSTICSMISSLTYCDLFCFIFRNILHSWMNFQYQKYCSNPQNLTLFKFTYLTKTYDQLTHLFYGIKTCEDFLFFMPTHIRRETACSIKVHIIKRYEVKRDYIYAILSTYVNNYILTGEKSTTQF